MDRRVKERLIGATILVVLLVLIVPELLSGPPRKLPTPAAPLLPAASGASTEAVRNVTVDLNTSKPTAAEPEAISESAPPAVSDSPAEPESAAAPAAPPLPVPTPQAQSPHSGAPVPATRPALDPARAPPIAAGAWSVQLGSFANRDNAENLSRQLKLQGYAAFIAPLGAGRSQRFRVRVGPLPDKAAAEHAAARMKAQGHAGSLVRPGHSG